MAKGSCEKRCLGRIINKERGIYCVHIEKKLPKPSRQSIKAYFTAEIERYSTANPKRNAKSLGDIISTLARFGLGLYEIKLIYYRAIKDMSFVALAKKQGWLNEHSAAYHYRKAIKKLRERGFKFK